MREKVLLWLRNPDQNRTLLSPHFDLLEPSGASLKDSFPAEELANIRIAVTAGAGRTPAQILDACPNLQILVCNGTGYDDVDLALCKQRGIRVAHSPDVNAASVAEQAMALALGLLRGIPAGDAYMRSGEWPKQKGAQHVQDGLTEARVGVYGMGAIGKKIASRCAAFEADVQYFSRRKLDDLPYKYHPSLEALADWCDVLLVAVRADAATRDVINADILRRLGPRGYLVNISRGSTVDENALVDALTSNVIAGAALDVFKNEPNINPALLTAPNLLMSPHRAGFTHEALQKMAGCVFANVSAFLDGKPMPYEVRS